jgi:hypothetical protein
MQTLALCHVTREIEKGSIISQKSLAGGLRNSGKI